MVNCDRSVVVAPTIKKKYRTPVILEKLGVVFNNKYFLCEKQQIKPDNFQVEHFVPHKEDVKLKYDWNNLFLACGDTCNQYKSQVENILNPCNPEHDVENLIVYELTYLDFEPHFYATDENKVLIKNTCQLLEKIHNGDKISSKNKTASLRNAIRRRATQLNLAIKNYFKAVSQNESVKKQKYEHEIKVIVSRKSPYTMLMRYIAAKDGFERLFD